MSKSLIEPTPYPEKIPPSITLRPQKPINSTSYETQMKILKNELGSLENKYDALSKLFNKSEKKIKEQTEELKKLNNNNEALSKETSIQKITIQKLTNEKSNLQKINDDNKKYIDKLEKKILNGVTNQFLIEQNKELKNRIDELEIENKKLVDKEEFFSNNSQKITEKMQKMENAMNLHIENLKNDLNISEISKEKMINFIKLETEISNLKTENSLLKNKNQEFESLSGKFETKLQEVNFAKSKLTAMLVEKENAITEMLNQKKDYEDSIEQLKTEKSELEKYKCDIQNNKKYEMLIQELSKNLKNMEFQNMKLVEKINLDKNKIESLEKNLDIVSKKNLKIENLYKENIEQNNLFLNEVETLKTECEKQIIEFNRLKNTNENNLNKINELNNKIHELENENIKLISVLNKQTFEKEYIQNDLVRQNYQILSDQKSLEEKILLLEKENQKLTNEKNEYKNLYNDLYNFTNQQRKNNNISTMRNQIKDIKNNFNKNETDEIDLTDNGNEVLSFIEPNEKQQKSLILTPVYLKEGLNTSIETRSCDNNAGNFQNKTCISPNMSNNKTDKILEMIRKEKNKKKLLDNEVKKISNIK